jgi:hypothetical protein
VTNTNGATSGWIAISAANAPTDPEIERRSPASPKISVGTREIPACARASRSKNCGSSNVESSTAQVTSNTWSCA